MGALCAVSSRLFALLSSAAAADDDDDDDDDDAAIQKLWDRKE